MKEQFGTCILINLPDTSATPATWAMKAAMGLVEWEWGSPVSAAAAMAEQHSASAAPAAWAMKAETELAEWEWESPASAMATTEVCTRSSLHLHALGNCRAG